MADTLEIFGVEYTGVTGIIATDDNGDDLTFTRGGVSPTLQSKTYTVSSAGTASVTPDSGYDGLSQVDVSVPTGSEGTPTATKSAVNNHALTVTPSVTNTAGYISGGTHTGTAVSVTAAELVSGTKSITANGTGIDVTQYAAVDVAVPTSGGASNIVQGTFTTGSTGGAVESVNIPYTGSGYPIAAVVYIDGGAYNPDISGWYNSSQRYAIGVWSMTKSVMTSTPTYANSGTQNQGVTQWIYKNTSSTSYNRSSAMNTYVYTGSYATGAGATCVRFRGNAGKTLSYYVASTSYGLLANMTYAYIVVYSS